MWSTTRGSFLSAKGEFIDRCQWVVTDSVYWHLCVQEWYTPLCERVTTKIPRSVFKVKSSDAMSPHGVTWRCRIGWIFCFGVMNCSLHILLFEHSRPTLNFLVTGSIHLFYVVNITLSDVLSVLEWLLSLYVLFCDDCDELEVAIFLDLPWLVTVFTVGPRKSLYHPHWVIYDIHELLIPLGVLLSPSEQL
jgi:hypothetical protein